MKPVQIKGGKKLSGFIKPMTATLSDQPAFDHKDWLFEIKWDGYRAITEVGTDPVRFYSRNGIAFNQAYPRIFKELEKIKVQAVIDGEVVVFDETGKPNFQKIQNYSSNKSLPIQYMAFDCLAYKGKDITHKPLLERKEILRTVLPKKSIIVYCDHVLQQGKDLFREITKAGLEGIIAKQAYSKYYPDRRSKEWLKIKNVLSDDFVIVGLTPPQGSRSYFGSLVIAENDTGELIPRGSVGTGFNEQTLQDVYGKLSKIIRKKSPLKVKIDVGSEVTWVDPKYVCQVKYTEITDDGNVRHPVFMGLRVDK